MPSTECLHNKHYFALSEVLETFVLTRAPKDNLFFTAPDLRTENGYGEKETDFA